MYSLLIFSCDKLDNLFVQFIFYPFLELTISLHNIGNIIISMC